MRLLFILLFLYYLLTMLYPSGDDAVSGQRIYPQVTMAVCALLCLYCTLKNHRQILQEKLFRPFFAMVILALVYVLYPFGTASELYAQFLFFLKSYMAIVFMFTVYVLLSKAQGQTGKLIYSIYALQLLYAFYQLWYDRQNMLMNDHEIFDSNSGFTLVCLIPMALMLPIRRLRFYICVLVLMGCIYSGQRSAALAAVLSIPFCLSSLRGSIKRSDVLLMVLAVIFVLFPILQEAIANIQMRNEIDATNDSVGSGRSVFWKLVWDDFWNGNAMQIFFGHGTNTVPELLGRTFGMSIGAHNGWLDMLYSFGLVGISLYVSMIWGLFKHNKRFSRLNSGRKNILLIIFIVFTVKCSTSHGYWDITVMPLSLAIAVVAAEANRRRTLPHSAPIKNTVQTSD